MKTIDTLIPDIYQLVGDSDALSETFSGELNQYLSRSVSDRIGEYAAQRGPSPKLRMSKLGPRCPRSLWYSANHPELAQAIPPWAKIKFAYGHLVEALALTLARAAGHTVEGEQSHVEVDGISGHRDCIIDGCVVDIKSCSSRAFIKFKDRTLAQEDNFGYLEQLDGYLVGSADDDLVTVKDHGYLWAIDKTLGHMVLYEHVKREIHIRERIRHHKAIIALDEPPRCTCETVPEGKSGNIALGVVASYSEFKFECNPGLRTFLYASGPKYLTRVVRKPDVTEIDRYGNVV